MRKTLVLTMLLAVLWPARAAYASCYAESTSIRDRLAEAHVAFVGTVQSTTNGGRFAVVLVEEVWRGSALPDLVEVHGTPVDDELAATSVDRTFTVGARYLFVPQNSGDDRAYFNDNVCSATREYSPELDQLRPRSGDEPATDETDALQRRDGTPTTTAADPVAPAPRVEHFVGQGEPIAAPVDTPGVHEPDRIVLTSTPPTDDTPGLTLPRAIAVLALTAVSGLVARRLLAPAAS